MKVDEGTDFIRDTEKTKINQKKKNVPFDQEKEDLSRIKQYMKDNVMSRMPVIDIVGDTYSKLCPETDFGVFSL